jgi:3-methyladenine DNA glycosylase AlkD
MNSQQIIQELRKHKNQKNIDGMKRFGIVGGEVIGWPSVPEMRKWGKKLGPDHKLALDLWKSGIHEARIIAGFTADPKLMTEKQMDSWVNDFDSWDVCDLVCSNLFDKTVFAEKKILEWTKSEKEFVRRAGFVLICAKTVHNKKAKDSEFIKYFPLIKKYSTDERNFVRKAVNWALRQIGKRNKSLNKKAITLAEEIKKIDSKSARWIASNALMEFRNEKITSRLR